MISYIKGELAEIGKDYIVVENNGIGYNIFVPGSLINQLTGTGTNVKIYTYLQIKEDSHSLYGFMSKETLSLFKLLINVNGIGPKGALAILTVMTTDDLKMAVISGDSKLISSAPGIGAKTAQKIILELKDKISLDDLYSGFDGESNVGNDSFSENGAAMEAVEALVSLGYGNAESLKAVRSIENTDGKNAESILKEALKKLARF